MNSAIFAAILVLGIYTAQVLDMPFVLLCALCTVIVWLVNSLIQKKFAFALPLCVVFFACGCVLYHVSAANELRGSTYYADRYVTVSGRICDVPQKVNDIFKYKINKVTVSEDGIDTKTSDKLIIYSQDCFAYGESAAFTGTLRLISQQANEYAYDINAHYKMLGITAKLSADKSERLDHDISDYSPEALSSYIKCKIGESIDRYYSDERGSVVKAVLTGDRSNFSAEFDNVLTATGSTRFFGSAYQVMIILGLIALLLVMLLGKKRSDIIMACIFVFYAFMHASSGAYMRFFVTAAVIVAYKYIFKAVYFPDVLAFATALIGICNPLILFDSGFLTATAAVIVIKLFLPEIQRKFFRIPGKHYRIKLFFLIYLLLDVCLCPLFAYFFNMMTPYGIIEALPMMAAAVLIMAFSPLFVIPLMIFGKAPVIGYLMTFLAEVMIRIPYAVAKLPLAHIYIAVPKVLFLIAYGLLVAFAALLIKKRRTAAFACMSVAAAFFLVLGIGYIADRSKTEVNFVNVSQGDGAAVKLPGNDIILIDGGGGNNYSDYNPGEKLFLPYLTSHGMTVIQSAYVSHCHQDHVQGIIAALNELKIKNLYLPKCSAENEWLAPLLSAAEVHGTNVHYVTEDISVSYGKANVTAYVNGNISSDNENENSLMIKLSCGSFNCLFTGDMSESEEYTMLKKGVVPHADVLKVAHHGSASSSCEKFIKTVDPQYSVISVGENNSYGLPAAATLARLAGTHILRTDKNGDIRVTADNSGNIDVSVLREDEN